jgi:glycosyltransferase involved in cell wall biosynthesis
MTATQTPRPGRRVLMVVENAILPRDPRVWAESLTLRDLGFDIEAIGPAPAEPPACAPYEERDGVAIFRYPASTSDGSFAGYLREYASASWRILMLARSRARVGSFDVIHVANPPDILLLALLPFKRGTKFVFDHHDLSPELYEVRFPHRRHVAVVLRIVERLSFALADVVISANESFRRLAVERGGVDPRRVFVVRNAPDPHVMKPGGGDPALKRGRRFLIAYVGLMDSQDGVELAVDALAELRRHRDDWHALLVGGGPQLEPLRERATRLGLDEVVEFTGWIEDRARLRQILDTADVCLSPEPKNPLNDASTLIKVAEYMSMAKPIVAFDLTETHYTAGHSAEYAAANDPTAFAQTVDRLLDDPVRRARMGAVGRARVIRDFSWDHSRTALADAYRYLLDDT